MPRVSVIVPAYNVELYIAEAVQSALSQTFRDFEIIVVNDGSTDRTARILEQFGNRIVLLQQHNKGLAAARNAALRQASGEYVALLDGDDVWLPRRLEKMVCFMEANRETSILTTDAYLIERGVRSTRTYYGSRPRRLRFRNTEQSYWIIQYNFVFGFVLCARDVFENYGAFDERFRTCEDWDLWIRCITSGANVSLIKEPLGFYRMRRESITASPSEMMSDEVSLLEQAANREQSGSIRGLQGRLSLARAKKALTEGDKLGARMHSDLAARDRDLPRWTRIRARLACIFPATASKFYARILGVRGSISRRA